jgi:GTP pyrophosphokinase
MKIVRTAKARSRIKRWIKNSQFEQSISLGEEIVTKNFKRYNIKKDNAQLEEIAQSYGFTDIEQLYASIGRGETTIHSVLQKIAPDKVDSLEDETLIKRFIRFARGSVQGVRVQGLDNLLITFAKCCQPVPGDQIIGFVSRGRGVVIHRNDCKNIIKLLSDPERKIDVEWDVAPDKQFMVGLKLLCEDRKHLLKEISVGISATDTNIVSINLNAQDSMVHGSIIIEVKNLNHLIRVMNKINKISGFISLERLNGI